MKTKRFERVECKTLVVVDNNGVERVCLSTDSDGGRIDIVDNKNEGGGVTINFNLATPSISLIHQNRKSSIVLLLDDNGGVINVSGKDGKTKVSLLVDESGEGLILGNEDVFSQTIDFDLRKV